MGGCSSKPSAAPAVPAAPAAPSKPSAGKYVIVGASGYIGKATVGALVAAVGGGNVIVATRNPTSPAGAEFTAQGATVVAGDLNNKASLIPVFAGAKAVYIITPGAEVQNSRGIIPFSDDHSCIVIQSLHF